MHQAKTVTQRRADHRVARRRSYQGERLQVEPEAPCTRALAYDQVYPKLLHGGVEHLLNHAAESMDLIDEEDVAIIETGQHCCKVAGALDCITRHGGDADDIEIAWVPGAFELPIAAKKLVATGRFDVVICLGAIVRSDTPHFDYVAGESAKGIARVGLDSGVPVIFGVVTADTVDQAVQRAGVKAGNRGWDAALNAVEMASLMAELG